MARFTLDKVLFSVFEGGWGGKSAVVFFLTLGMDV